MSASQVRIYHVKAEDLFYLIPHKGMIDYEQASSRIDLCWLECLNQKLKSEYEHLSQTIETLIEAALKGGEKGFEFSTIIKAFRNAVGSNPCKFNQKDRKDLNGFTIKVREKLIRKMCVIRFALIKVIRPMVDELKKISKQQPVVPIEMTLEKLSDLPKCLERLELSKDLEKIARKVLGIRVKRHEVLSSENLTLISDAYFNYSLQLVKLMSIYPDVFELIMDLKVYREKDKIIHDFVWLKTEADEAILNKTEIENMIMRGDVLNFKNKIGLMMQENIKQSKKVCNDLLNMYKTFPKLPKN